MRWTAVKYRRIVVASCMGYGGRRQSIAVVAVLKYGVVWAEALASFVGDGGTDTTARGRIQGVGAARCGGRQRSIGKSGGGEVLRCDVRRQSRWLCSQIQRQHRYCHIATSSRHPSSKIEDRRVQARSTWCSHRQ